jgi:hypothetical protein
VDVRLKDDGTKTHQGRLFALLDFVPALEDIQWPTYK